MMILQFPAAPLLLGFILGPMIEETLRRALLISRGDLSILVSSPISAFFVAATVLVIAFSIWPTVTRIFTRSPRAPEHRLESPE